MSWFSELFKATAAQIREVKEISNTIASFFRPFFIIQRSPYLHNATDQVVLPCGNKMNYIDNLLITQHHNCRKRLFHLETFSLHVLGERLNEHPETLLSAARLQYL